MASQVSRFKIGLFVVLGMVALVLTTIGIGSRLVETKALDCRSFFDESVQGLDVGAPVNFRGVTIGRVSGIHIAQDRRHVEVIVELSIAELQELGLVSRGDEEPRLLPSDIRASIASQGLITGVKFISLDYLDPKVHPPPTLSFTPPPNYIPSAKSALKSVEDAVVRAADKLPELSDAVVSTMSRVDGLLAELEKEGVSESLGATLRHADQVLGDADRTIRGINAARLPERSSRTLDELQRAVVKVNTVLDHVDGDGGLVASASRAADAIGDLGSGTRRTSRELESTMRDVQEASDAIRMLAEELEREPDMLLKGRAKAKTR